VEKVLWMIAETLSVVHLVKDNGMMNTLSVIIAVKNVVLDNLNTFGLCEACEDEEDEED
jgi:hypothetical protein